MHSAWEREPAGRVAGDLSGIRLALVEEALEAIETPYPEEVIEID